MAKGGLPAAGVQKCGARLPCGLGATPCPPPLQTNSIPLPLCRKALPTSPLFTTGSWFMAIR